MCCLHQTVPTIWPIDYNNKKPCWNLPPNHLPTLANVPAQHAVGNAAQAPSVANIWTPPKSLVSPRASRKYHSKSPTSPVAPIMPPATPVPAQFPSKAGAVFKPHYPAAAARPPTVPIKSHTLVPPSKSTVALKVPIKLHTTATTPVKPFSQFFWPSWLSLSWRLLFVGSSLPLFDCFFKDLHSTLFDFSFSDLAC
jgi:hypothetical protein